MLAGLDALGAATALLQRARLMHPTAGLIDAADVQWWWRTPVRTDDVPKVFWFDDAGRPVAAVIATDCGDAVPLDPLLLPDASPASLATVIDRGLDHAAACGFDSLEVVVDVDDEVSRELLTARGFATADHSAAPAVQSAWLATPARPAVSPLADGYRLRTRLDTMPAPHHMVTRSGPEVEARLRQASLYRPEFDLVVLADDGPVAGYGLFWMDPVTRTGMVEPMRTEEDHQRRGVARHVITAGVRLLAEAGAQRIKISYDPHNQPARDLYASVGFRPHTQTMVLARRS